METFKSWLLSVCGASAISALCKILISKSKLKKISNVFFSIFVLFYMLLPLDNIYHDKNFDDLITYDESSFDTNYKNGYQKMVTEAIKNICNENNTEIISVDIDSYIDEDGYLVVNTLTVDIGDNEKILDTESSIKNTLGFEVTVI